MSSRPQVWAHRGASSRPGNSLDTLCAGIAVGADGIELDVQRTADGILVVTHDETTDRLTGQPGQVAQLTLADLRRLDFAAFWPDQPAVILPTLDEVLDLCRNTSLRINIELKTAKSLIGAWKASGRPSKGIWPPGPGDLFQLQSHESVALELDCTSCTKGLPVQRRPTQTLAASLSDRCHCTPPVHSQPGRARPGSESPQSQISRPCLDVDEPGQWEQCRQLAIDAIITNQPREALEFYNRI